MRQAVIHKQMNGLFTTVAFYGNNVLNDIEIVWACPVLGRAERPHLLGLEIK